MVELAELVLKETGSSSALVRNPLPQDDPKQRRPDISVAKKQLGLVAEGCPARGSKTDYSLFPVTLI